MHVEDLRAPRELTQAFVKAGIHCGIPHNADFNGETQEGIGLLQVTMKRGARHSAATAYLNPVLKRSNLKVITEAMVTRLYFEGRRVIGMEYTQNGETHTASAEREVILCGGSINSPQLLMLSGIGAGEHLQEMGIPVVADLHGVGKNLQDHLALGIMYRSKLPHSLANAESPLNLAKYLAARTGPLSSNVAEASAFVRSAPDLPVPDIQYHFAPNFFINHGFDNPEGHGYSLGAVMVAPHSRGEIMLNSPDPTEHPNIDPRYFSDDSGRDLAAGLYGVKLAREILAQAPFARYNNGEYLPGEHVQRDEDLIKHIRETSQTLYHPVGTCKMGNDAMAVVDAQLRVRGVEGLRVVDASIMPVVTNGNTNAPTIMIAEKAADMIRSAQ